ncbi:ABC transporter substrate-binding protein [Nordella sp. HKS 07]|uniref:ABC transporter substrate-binding protein n=1 Tax=Nordella sp. HKS 07 TaxID=2712222 RepID=UPI0013E139A8|nr:ABC transporter substrate-binding protein [Nordella sp. HKS 07]QIG49649.1 ABC transporter substrate-binding protein [Nordella sp. HKS 07]
MRPILALSLLALVVFLHNPAFAQQGSTAAPEGGQPGDGQSEIRLGMSADFSASARALSIELYRGAMAYLTQVNEAGGVQGRRVVITAYDDKYQPDLAIRNTLRLMKENVFALFSYVGTPTMIRTLPLLRMRQGEHFLLFFPFTGADASRVPPYDMFSFNLRASYDQETKGLVDHFVAAGRTRIAVFYQADAYGRTGWAGVRKALAGHGLEIAGEATYRRGSPYDQSYDGQVAVMERLKPDAIICIGTYPACAGFVRNMRDRDVDAPVATISFVGSDAMLRLLSDAEQKSGKDYTSRLVSSQVVPSYQDDAMPVVREYRAAMDRYGDAIMPPDSLLYPGGKTPESEYAPLPYSFVSFEGYLNARMFVAILQRMCANPKRSDLAQAALSMGEFDPGLGQKLFFGAAADRRQASDQVYYTVVRGGQFVPLRVDEWEAWLKR